MGRREGEGGKRLAKSDPMVQCSIEESGEHIVAGESSPLLGGEGEGGGRGGKGKGGEGEGEKGGGGGGKRLAKSDPMVQCSIEESGEHIMAGESSPLLGGEGSGVCTVRTQQGLARCDLVVIRR